MSPCSGPPIRAVLVSLYSRKYPAIGESHGLSVVAGSLRAEFSAAELTMRIFDMVQWGEEHLSRVCSAVRVMRANLLVIGLPYGTFTVIKQEYAALREALTGTDALVVMGGPIATYQSERLLLEVAPEAVMILGEAEDALPMLVKSWIRGSAIADVPGLHYMTAAATQMRTARRLVNLANAPAPVREHIRPIHTAGGQIFAESSRGCGWAACTFCLRGLTDIAGRSTEYRRKPATRVAEDLSTLTKLGVSDVTFADEDFLGPSIEAAAIFVDQLNGLISAPPRFDASLTVHSVYSRRDTPEDSALRGRTLRTLAKLGLQKAFLGIESCSPSQLRRYAKGHTREEAVQAVRTLQSLGIRVEIGVILFDPLCTLDEVEDSLRFMLDNGLVQLASNISNELRLQVASHYLNVLRNYEAQHGPKLYETSLDPDTLSYRYVFADAQIAELHRSVRSWNTRLYSLYYPAKSLSRYGATGAVGEAVYSLREATSSFRVACCDAMLMGIKAMKERRDAASVLNEHFRLAAAELGWAILMSVDESTSAHSDAHPVIRQVRASARAAVTAFGDGEYTF